MSISSGLEKLFLASKPLYSLAFRGRYLYHQLTGRNVLLVFQMGKVGSSTVVNSLENLNLNQKIYQIHFLSDEGRKFMGGLQMANYGSWKNHPNYVKKHVLTCEFLNRIITNSTKKFKVISLIRDPVATNISGFFHNYHSYVPEIKNSSGPIDMKIIEDRFFKEYADDIPLTWFDSEMKKTFEIDVFENDFPKSKGYGIYENEKAELLVIKLEKIKESGKEAIENFLDIKNFEVLNSNQADDLEYFDTYKQFLNEVKIPESYLDRIYNSKFCRHFYSEEEIMRFVQKWKR